MTDLYPNRLADLTLEARLSTPELEVARLMACGLTNSAIGKQLYRSEYTVKTQLGHMFRKTGTTNRGHLVVWMYETGHILPGVPGFPPRPRPPRIAPPRTSPRASPADGAGRHITFAARSSLRAVTWMPH
ncbi:response regulator transcription factor [Saccharopolyspora gloriosae]|uniref:response regulator transcription factor n=1 Tax=Saccharopolyspora gloriosae TaxID=455344 RepID=UPI001FB5C2B5|nr:helix-turn-helix transcriptional regulator [Saccharopolyspora gloriosae]